MHTSQELVCTLSMRVRKWCAPWAYASVPYAHAQHAHQFSHFSNIHFVYPQHACKELMRALLSLWVSNWWVYWAFASWTILCTERSPFKTCWAYVSGALCVPWAHGSGTDAHTEHPRQKLICALSVVTSKHAEHTCQELMRTLSIRVRNWCDGSGTDAFAQCVRNWCVPWAFASVFLCICSA